MGTPFIGRHTRRGALALVGAAGLALASCGESDAALTKEGLPRYAYRSEPALASYRYAVAAPALLAQLPCYCGCGKLEGFENLRDCFISAAGDFNAHGANCQTCIDEALDAKKLQAQSLPMAQIRRVIDETYRGRGTPTTTPPVE